MSLILTSLSSIWNYGMNAIESASLRYNSVKDSEIDYCPATRTLDSSSCRDTMKRYIEAGSSICLCHASRLILSSKFGTSKSHHIGAACSYSSFGLHTQNFQILYIRKPLVSWDLLSSRKRSNVWHSVKANNLDTSVVASKELIPFLTDKGDTDGFQGGILCTNDCSCTSLVKRVIRSCFTASFAPNRDTVHVIVRHTG